MHCVFSKSLNESSYTVFRKSLNESCVFRKSLIESSTDTLVGELEGRLLALPLAATAVQYLEPLDSDGLVSQNDEVSGGNSKLHCP